MEADALRNDPLKMVEHVLGVLRRDDDRDEAIERLILELEDERAVLLAARLGRRERTVDATATRQAGVASSVKHP